MALLDAILIFWILADIDCGIWNVEYVFCKPKMEKNLNVAFFQQKKLCFKKKKLLVLQMKDQLTRKNWDPHNYVGDPED